MKNIAVSVAKRVARGIAPGFYSRIREGRPVAALSAFRSRYGLCVAGGPFAGMRYISESAGSALLPKLVGSYEHELHPLIASLPARGYPIVVDIGCAEGYYAVGFARMFGTAAVRGYDTDPRALALCRKLALENEVADRVEISGACSKSDLAALSNLRGLLVCDCEGYEAQLFDSDVVRGLSRWDCLVETHDFIAPGCTEALRNAFAKTHSCEVFSTQPRDWRDFAPTRAIQPWNRKLAVDERRHPEQVWLWLRADR